MERAAHIVTLTHAGAGWRGFLFRFLRTGVAVDAICRRSRRSRKSTLATDWDTEHSLALAPERTAWFVQSLGFTGRQNHYVGALWFYELVGPGHAYASGTVTFTGTPACRVDGDGDAGAIGDPASNWR